MSHEYCQTFTGVHKEMRTSHDARPTVKLVLGHIELLHVDGPSTQNERITRAVGTESCLNFAAAE
jgi:hypothetical protein